MQPLSRRISREAAAGLEQKSCDAGPDQRSNDEQPHLPERAGIAAGADDCWTQ